MVFKQIGQLVQTVDVELLSYVHAAFIVQL